MTEMRNERASYGSAQVELSELCIRLEIVLEGGGNTNREGTEREGDLCLGQCKNNAGWAWKKKTSS